MIVSLVCSPHNVDVFAVYRWIFLRKPTISGHRHCRTGKDDIGRTTVSKAQHEWLNGASLLRNESGSTADNGEHNLMSANDRYSVSTSVLCETSSRAIVCEHSNKPPALLRQGRI